MKKTWFSIQNKAETQNAIEVSIYDEIGIWGITASDFIHDFKAIDDGTSPVVVAINSPGGNAFDGIALNGFLSRLGERCTARIDGLAASAASIVAIGAAKVRIGESAMMMIHQPWQIAAGNAEDLRKAADDLDKISGSIRAAYKRKAPALADDELDKMMDAEAWLSAQESVALGLADEITESASVKACRGSFGLLERYGKLPQAIQESGIGDQPPAPEPPPEPEPAPAPESIPEPAPNTDALASIAAQLAAACVKAGIPQLTEHIIMATPKTKASANAEVTRIGDIGNLCAAARLPELAVDYVKAGITAEEVRARLFDRIVAHSGEEIDNKEPAAPVDKPKAKLDAKKIYSARKAAK